MAVHILDDGATIYSYGVDSDGNPTETPITDATERHTFFDGVASEQLRLLRKERTQKLDETDWVVTKYTELGQPIPSEWATYRQALRGITSTYTSQFDVVWPEKSKNGLRFKIGPRQQKL